MERAPHVLTAQWRLKDAGWVATARERLQSLSWFMKCLVALAVSH